MKTHSRKLLVLIKNDEEYLLKRNNTSNSAIPVSLTSTRLETSDDSTETPTKPGLTSPTLGFDTSMALTFLVLLTALFFMVFFSMYLRRFAADDQSSLEISARRRRQLHRRSSNNNTSTSSSSNSLSVRSDRQAGLDSFTVKSLPMFAYEHGDSSSKVEAAAAAAEGSIDCVVCLSEFEERETVKMIPYCGHVFHPECIDTWFSTHVSCPLCRSTKLFSSTSTAKNKNHDDSIIMIDKQPHYHHPHHQVMDDAIQGSMIRNDDTGVVADRGLEGSSHITRNSSWPKMQIDKGSTPALTRSSSF
ncbi:hypothetical protein MKX01_009027 [Papaver californicum]|nr:hypothetical protein MKX01_009027 [Papaver californicum]